jgi:transketolase
VVVDYNKIQSFGRVEEVLALEPFADKWRAFGWHVVECDGHDRAALERALTAVPEIAGKPTVLMAHTVKGKGVHFMEDKLEWHYKSPSQQQLLDAIAEVEAS